MSNYSRKTLDFLLHDVFKVSSLFDAPYYQSFDVDTVSFILDTAEDITEKYLSSEIYTSSDRQVPELLNGQIKVHEGLHAFVKAYAEAGFISATFSEDLGGMQMPKIVKGLTEFINLTAHNSFLMFTDLAIGTASLVAKFGTEQQQKAILPKLFNGTWLGTMCLTEPQAGSSLAEVTCKAIPQTDGTYLIEGQKIFISAGDHDISENILHFVLARVPGAPVGVKGISLFIVPKNKMDNPAKPNGVTTLSVFHKMGQKATPAVHLAFGSDQKCQGYLLGEENAGLLQMFEMMNTARLGVGISGIGIASAAYHQSLQYAKERKQGKSLDKNWSHLPAVAIIQHPDIRRMLLSQKVIYQGGLALLLQNYFYLDMQQIEPSNPKWSMLSDLLTPVSKTYGAEQGAYSVSQGLQVLGGYGYTEDFMLEQLYRDVRIMSIYEGTTGIQSLTLLGRQVGIYNGQALTYLVEEIEKTLMRCKAFDNLLVYVKKMSMYLSDLKELTSYLLSLDSALQTLANATLYMEYFSQICVGWQWLKISQIAEENLISNTGDITFLKSQLHSMRFFFAYELSKISHLKELLMSDEHLTHFDQEQDVLS